MKKKYALDAAQIKPLAPKRGGCIATDRITVDGKKVGYMVRDKPVNANDSGWQFFSGDESQAYLDDTSNSTVFDVNTLANFDPAILPYLDAPFGTAFERAPGSASFVQVRGTAYQPGSPAAKPWPPPGFPLVEGKHVLTAAWAIHLPEPFARRVQDGSLVLWRPGLTLWLDAWGNDRRESQADRLAAFKKSASPARFAEREAIREGVTRFDYRLRETNGGRSVESLNAMLIADHGHLQMGIYFDDPSADEAKARQLVDSVVARRPG